jgi:ABC-2 type transport system ATP-binding protein
MLPMRAHYVPRVDAEDLANVLPADAVHNGRDWRFTVPEGGAEAIVMKLIQSGHGLEGLTMERPGLHDAFVSIVQAVRAEEGGEAA